MANPPAPPYQARPAGFLIRTAAYLVDAFLLSLVGGAFPYLFLSTGTQNPNQPVNGAAAPAGGASLLLSLLDFVLLWSHVGGGRTFGMRVFGLRVVGAGGGLIGGGPALVRWIGLWISFVVCFIGVLWVAGDRNKQGWHDHLAHTYVVHV
jgi:uncharacterized RDD family membrane protein YckC